MKTILAIFLTITAAHSESFGLVWDYDTEPRLAAFEIDSRPLRPVGLWAPIGVAFDATFSGDLPRGVYQFRVRARMESGEVSAWSNTCMFALPKPPPPVTATHCRVIVRDSTGAAISEMLDPINSDRVFFKMSPDGTQALRSINLIDWQAFGPVFPVGNYKIESTLAILPP